MSPELSKNNEGMDNIYLNPTYTSKQTFFGLLDVLKASSKHILKASSTRLQRNNFLSPKTFQRRLDDVLKTCIENFIKTSWRQTKCFLEIALSNKSKSVYSKSISQKSISNKSKANPKYINQNPIISILALF